MCNFCSKKDGKEDAINDSIAMNFVAVISGEKLVLFESYLFLDEGSFYGEIKIKYCPMCGKKLNE